MFVICYSLTGLGVTVGFHRHLTHRAFKAKRWVRGTLAVLGSAAIEGPGDLVGRRSPQAPRVLRRRGRPAQPPRRPRGRPARRAARPLARPRRLAVHPHSPRQQGALRARPAQGPADPLRRPDVRALGHGRPGRAVLPRLAIGGSIATGADRPAVGRRRAHAGRAPRHLQHQLAVPLLRPQGLRHRRRVAQPRLARAVHLRRGVAQQPPRVPDLRTPTGMRPLAVRPVARSSSACSSASASSGTSSASAQSARSSRKA